MAVRKEFRDLAPPEEAHSLIADFELGGAESVPIDDARGRVLAERIDATIDVPGFDRALVDGYAVRARDTFGANEANPVRLEVVGTVEAGEEPDERVEPGNAIEIATGGVLPDGADAVVMVERTGRDGATVLVRTGLAPGDGVMVAGADIGAGERALGPGRRLTPREIGLLSALGRSELPVRRAPRVAIISTGDELVYPGEELDSDAGEIYDVNSYTLGASVEEAGGEPVYYPHVGDDYEELRRVLTDAATACDLVLTSGSTSAGAADHIYRLVEERGELDCHGVAVKPGKPMLIGRLEGTPFVGLPGFPVSALTIFQVFVTPAIREGAGRPSRDTPTISGTMARTERYKEGRTRFMPVGLVEDGAGNVLVDPVDKGSGATTSLVEADGIVEIEPNTEQLDAGATVAVTPFSADTRPPDLLGVGEDGPLVARLLDGIDRPRYLPVGSREGLRRLAAGVPDVAVTAGPVDRDVEAVTLGGWTRTWGLVVPPDNPADVTDLADLLAGELQFVNRPRPSGLRASLEAELEALAAERDRSLADLLEEVDGFELTARAHESPPRRVLAGTADVALGLAATASKMDLGFVPLGRQPVSVLALPDRIEKPAVRALADAFPLDADGCAGLEGVDPE